MYVQTDSVQALRIFMEDVEDVKSLPRELVLPHLTKHAPHNVIPYLVSCSCYIMIVFFKKPDSNGSGLGQLCIVLDLTYMGVVARDIAEGLALYN